ncbi:MAG TPA: PEGA domain-containing protein [Blastocatellia bacterium]|nr:PEGA domain-containing protein [Blastocatellia bacterium]
MRREFHASALSRLPVFICLVSVLFSAPACDRTRTNSGNEHAANSNAAQPAPSPPGAAEETAANGQIEIVSTPPGAMVILIEIGDGFAGPPQVKGSTPTTLSVKPGAYEVALEKTGHKHYQKEVKVEANKTVKLNARLPRA